MIFDFSKAFDTSESSFINTTHNIFNFGKRYINLVNLCQRNSSSRVEQNGHLTEKIVLLRGCCQGNTLSPYVFVLFADILSHVLRGCGRSEVVHDTEFKVSQCDDDTTFLI